MCTAILEALASKGYRTTTVFFYENTMQVKFSENQTVSDMFEMLRSNVFYDMGYAFDTSVWSGLNMGDLQMEAIYTDKGWASEWESIKDGIYQCIDSINRAYGKPA